MGVKNSKPAVISSEPITQSGTTIRILDLCLFESLAFLSRDDIDSLPLVNHQFAHVLSHPQFVLTPLRILHKYECKYDGQCLLHVDRRVVDSHARLFSLLQAKNRQKQRRTKENRQLASYYDGFYGSEYSEINIVEASQLELLGQSPWLRIHYTSIRLEINTQDTKISPAYQLMAFVNKWTPLTGLWKGFDLKITIDRNWGRVAFRNVSWPAGDGTLHLGALMNECRRVELADWVSAPSSSDTSLSLTNWESNAAFPKRICLSKAYGGMTPKRVVGYLFSGVEEERRLSFESVTPSSDFSLHELHALCISVRHQHHYDAYYLWLKLCMVVQRFWSTSGRLSPFSLSMDFYGSHPQISMEGIHEKHSHPTEQMEGKLFIEMQEDAHHKARGTIPPRYTVYISFPCTW